MDSTDLVPQPCTDVYNAAFCVKLVGRYEGKTLLNKIHVNKQNLIISCFLGGLGVKRYCSSHDLGNYCNYIKQPGDKMEYRTCVYTCDSDGCNGSSQIKLFACLMGIPIFSLFNWILF